MDRCGFVKLTSTNRKEEKTMNIGSKITMARQQCGMTQSELADKMCVTRQTVSRWEAGTAFPDVEKVAHIAKLLGVSCDYLLDDTYEAGSPVETKEEKTGQGNNCVTTLLQSLVGKKVHIDFYEDEEDYEIVGEVCRVEGFEGNWIRLQILKAKETKEKLIALSSVLSFGIVEEDA